VTDEPVGDRQGDGVESGIDLATAFGDADLAALFDMQAPQPRYAEMVKQHLLMPMPGMAVIASREAVDTVLRNHEIFTSEFGLDLGNIRPLIPLSVDPPKHSKYRKILDPLFAPRRMDAIEDDVAERVNHFIDAFVDHGECNFTEDFAELFPSSVFLGLMGLPWDELQVFLRLRDGILRPHLVDPNAMLDPAARLAVTRATGSEIYEYFGAFLDERVKRPTDDILTHFLTAEIDGEKLSREEILDICFLFLIAGLDTVSDSLTCFYAFLARNPAHRAQLAADPSLIPNAVEELLRWETPVAGVPRMAKVDSEVAGILVPAGTMVQVSVGAANVDPAEFPDGFEVRFDREVNRHLAFGGGVHRCLGSHLARRELRVTLREWHRRIPEYSIKPGHEELEYPPGLRSVKDLTLVWPT
jgi:cytochrome P450